MTAPTQDLAQAAEIVFRGTVERVAASTNHRIPVDERTAILRIDQVLQCPAQLRNYAGQKATVQLTAPVTVGQSLIVYANGWVFGETMTLQSIGHAEAATVDATHVDPVAAYTAAVLRRQFQAADLVVSGRISTFRAGRRWRLAEIEVNGVHKGKHAGATVEALLRQPEPAAGYFLLRKSEAGYVLIRACDFLPQEGN